VIRISLFSREIKVVRNGWSGCLYVSFYLLLSIFIPVTVFLVCKALIGFIKERRYNGTIESSRQIVKKIVQQDKLSTVKIIIGFSFFFLFFRVLRQEFNIIFKHCALDHNFALVVSFILLFSNQAGKDQEFY